MIFDAPSASLMARARPLGSFLCDAVFQVAASLFTGPDNGFGQRDGETARIPLERPQMPARLHDGVATIDLIGREAALVAFYEGLIAAAETHGKQDVLARPFPSFRVTPVLLEADKPLLSFPWTDDMRETTAILTALAGAGADGVVWEDIDQGWFVHILCRDGTIFMMEGDPDEEEPDVVVRAEARAVAAQARDAAMRLKALHNHLTEAFGRDFWTSAR